MSAQIITLGRTSVDATDWTPTQIRQYMKDNGWEGFRPDSERFQRTGELILYRTSGAPKLKKRT